MNLNNLNYFRAVAEELNITHASKKLHISQQALSNHISKLEAELGVPLFQRTPTFSLTYAGERLFETSSHIMDIHSQFLSEIKDINGEPVGKLKIGITHTRGQALLPLILPDFMKAHPNVIIQIEEANSKTLEDKLAHGEVDLVLGILPFSNNSAVVTRITTDRLFLAVPVSIMEELYPDKDERELVRAEYRNKANINTFKDMPFILLKKGDRIRSIADTYFKNNNILPHVAVETGNIQTAFALASVGLGIAFYPEMFLRGTTTLSATTSTNIEMDYYPLATAATTEELAIAYNRERYLSLAGKEFIEFTKNALH